jgi:hypothetical protein
MDKNIRRNSTSPSSSLLVVVRTILSPTTSIWISFLSFLFEKKPPQKIPKDSDLAIPAYLDSSNDTSSHSLPYFFYSACERGDEGGRKKIILVKELEETK